MKLVLSTIFALTLAIAASTTVADSSVWKISKGEDYFYLGGTIHVLRAQDYPLPQAFMTAYEDADKLIFETDIVEAQSHEFQQKSMMAMMDPSGRTLADKLSPQTYSELESFLTPRGIALGQLANFEPWAAALMATMVEYQRLGALPDYGVETYFSAMAMRDGKAMGQLETGDEQLGFLASLGTIDPDMMVSYTVDDLNNLPMVFEQMTAAWRAGNIDALVSYGEMEELRNEMPKIYQTIFVNRNNDWMTKLPALIGNDEIEYVLVGSLHLPFKEGLLNQLEQAGFEIEQLSK